MSHFEHNIPGYELIRELGSGGMAVVYLGIQRSLDRKVAIKIMRRNIDDIEKFERRFLMEGRTMAKLPHRNIVAVYDIVKTDEHTYISMEYLDGGTLSTKMKDGMSLAEAISVIVQIAQSLQFAHEHGIVHRDLKPANIMFRDAHTPVLTDFGIAKHQDAAATRLTQTGMLVGTPTYMSPEQINALDVDGRSDLYSLGILFYELLTGSPPFSADTPIAVLMAHLTTPPPNLPSQFADFQGVLDRMLAKNRDDRFPNLREFVKALKGSVINNQMLWARLQSDPNQSSSEQLRALGFSASGDMSGGMGGGPSSGEVRLPPNTRGQQRTPSGQQSYDGTDVSPRRPATAQQALFNGGPAPAQRRTGMWIGIAAALMIGVGLGGYLIFRPGGAGNSQQVDPKLKILVDASLERVDKLIASGNLLTPPTENAYEYLRSVQQLAPDYAGTQLRIAALAGAFKKEAAAALAKQDFDTAVAQLERARQIWDKDPELAKIEKSIADGRTNVERDKLIAGFLTRADAATREGRDVGPGSAYSILAEARARAPNDPKVKAAVDALIERVLSPAKDALARGDNATAFAAIKRAESSLSAEPAWKALKTQVDQAVQNQQSKLKLDGLLAKIDDEIRRGQLLQPSGDNAEETLAQAVQLDATSADVKQRQQSLADALVKRGQSSFASGQFDVAVASANAALGVLPSFAPAQQLKQQSEGKISATQAKVIAGVAAATQAQNAQRFLSPANDNAKALLEGVLQLDPRNIEAQSMLKQLPTRIAEAARTRAGSNDLAGAQKLVDEGLKAFPNDPTFVALGSEFSRQLAEVKAKAAREEKLGLIGQAIAARPLKAEVLAQAARDIATLVAANPRDTDALTLRQQWFDSLGESLKGADSVAEVDQIANALKLAQLSFQGEPRLAQLQTDVVSVRTRVEADEQARLLASSGELVLNAYPWATVESVVGQDKKPIALTGDRTTPLTLKLPAGVYYVTFKHPQVTRTSTEVAQVSAKQRTTAATSFAAAITSKDYLKRAGF